MTSRSAQTRRIGNRLVQMAFLVVLFVLWYLATNFWGVNHLLLPNPVAVFHQLVDVLQGGEYLPDLRVTATEFVVAFVLATTTGTIVGFFVSLSRYSVRV